VSVESAVNAVMDDLRVAVRSLVQQLDDDELRKHAQPFKAGESPYAGRDAHMAWVAFRAAARVEARRRGLVE